MSLIFSFLNIITRFVSSLFGVIAKLEQPSWLSKLIIQGYCYLYKINFDEAILPASSYKSLLALFLRDLKQGSRPIPSQAEQFLLSPVDGELREVFNISFEDSISVKGLNWNWSKLVPDPTFLEGLSAGQCFNFYLSPKDYHHVHSPYSGVVTRILHVPGSLLPVNDWSIKTFPNLFSLNERVIIQLKAKNFTYLLILVGALNVGSIKLEPCPEFNKRLVEFKPKEICNISKKDFAVGERIASFALGSSVLMLLPPSHAVSLQATQKKQLKYASIIGQIKY